MCCEDSEIKRVLEVAGVPLNPLTYAVAYRLLTLGHSDCFTKTRVEAIVHQALDKTLPKQEVA